MAVHDTASNASQESHLDEKHIVELAVNAKYVRNKAGEVVFEYESIGDLFYVILSGVVSVQTPITDFEVETFKRAATIGSKVTFFKTNYEMIDKISKIKDKTPHPNNSRLTSLEWDSNSYNSDDEAGEEKGKTKIYMLYTCSYHLSLIQN
jgi:hypothetical protein